MKKILAVIILGLATSACSALDIGIPAPTEEDRILSHEEVLTGSNSFRESLVGTITSVGVKVVDTAIFMVNDTLYYKVFFHQDTTVEQSGMSIEGIRIHLTKGAEEGCEASHEDLKVLTDGYYNLQSIQVTQIFVFNDGISVAGTATCI